jgi:type VI secretion system protein ImpJ
MFLGPHHFQQHDRFLLNQLNGVANAHGSYGFGLLTLDIDQSALAEGKIALNQASGLFPDHTPFSLPEDAPLPAPLEIEADTKSQVISLAIPFENVSEKEIAEHKAHDNFSRYLLSDQSVRDQHSLDSDSEEDIFTAELWTRLIEENQNAGSYYTVPIARVIEKRDDQSIVLDKNFYPCAMSLRASSALTALCKELHGMLLQRTSELAGRLGTPNASDTSQLIQFLLLQITNRYKPLLEHIAHAENDHPEHFYRELVQLAGELCTITSASRVAPEFPPYLHRDQFQSFTPVADSIRQSLNWIPDSVTESINVKHVKAGIYTATVADKHLFDSARFILAVKARVTPDELQKRFPRQTTISSKNQLRALVEAQARGIELAPLITVPNAIPMYENNVYFELRPEEQLWREIATSGDIAMHIAGNYPDLAMQLWTIQR